MMELLAQAQTIPTSLPDRFRSRIVVDPATGCWIWTGSNQGRQGYGIYRADPNGKKWSMAHRVSYEALKGPIPEGLTLDHLCRTHPCVNPAHTEPVTSRINTLRGNSPPAINARKIFCKRGHPLFGANLYLKTRYGWPVRECRACRRVHARRWREKRKHLAGTGKNPASELVAVMGSVV